MANTPKPKGRLYIRRQGYAYEVCDAAQPGEVLAVGADPEDAAAKARALAPDQERFLVDERRDEEF